MIPGLCRRTVTAGLLLALGCSGGGEPCPDGFVRNEAGQCNRLEDTGEDTGLLNGRGWCPVSGGYSGLTVGEASCEGGICEVPEGNFWMGSDDGQPDECPPRAVGLSAFAIDAYEVTRGAYVACVDAGGCSPVPTHCDNLFLDFPGDAEQIPAVCATWQQASDYCAWVGGRLPRETEWEKAARGDDGATWAWGAAPPSCGDANFRFVSWYCEESVVEVGTYTDSVSPYGLWDTVGNAWEWVDDWYDAGVYEDMDDEDPQGPESCRAVVAGEPGACTDKVIRGGAFNTTEDTTRGSARSFADPSVVDVNLAFRCAYDR